MTAFRYREKLAVTVGFQFIINGFLLTLKGPSNGESGAGVAQHLLSESNVARKESYKLQRKNYRFEKKKAANELLCSHKDPAVTVLADWLKGKCFCAISFFLFEDFIFGFNN